MRAFARAATKSQRIHVSETAKAMLALLPSRLRHELATDLVAGSVVGRGRLHCATKLDYYFFPPEILIDDIFQQTDGASLVTAVKMFMKTEVMDVVKLVAENYDDPESILARMKVFKVFENYEEAKIGRWTDDLLKRFIFAVCKTVGEPVPAEARPIIIRLGIRNILQAYAKNEMEDQDAFPLVKMLIGDEKQLTKFAVGIIKEKFPSLASFISERFRLGPIDFKEEFVPSCAEPYNGRLHDLPISGEVVIKDSTHVINFVTHLNRSRYFAMDFQVIVLPGEEKETTTIVSFCFRSKVFFAMPVLFPEMLEPVVNALKADPKLAIVYQWQRRKKTCLEVLRWAPEQTVDALDVAKEIGITVSIDGITERTVGGAFCRRASKIPATVIPSAPALQHRAIRVTLFYEFVARERKLREMNEKKKNTRYDKEGEELEHRLSRKYARDNDGHSRDRRRDDGRSRKN